MAEVEGLALAGVAVHRAELLGGGPGAEGRRVASDGVRGVERVGLAGRPAKEMKLPETGHLVEPGAPAPDGLGPGQHP